MNVTELFRRLSYGELANLSIGSEASGVIAEDKREKVIYHTNIALLRLYSRFVLKENQLSLRNYSHITRYELIKDRATMSGSPELTKYIEDWEQRPFEDDLIRVLSVYDQLGRPYVLNDVDDTSSLFTPEPKVLQVPMPISDRIMDVIYQARHVHLTYENLEAEIHIPDVLEEALTAHIAYQIFSGMTGQDAAARAALSKYEMICAEINDRDLVSSSSSSTTSKLHDRGFV